MKCANPVVLSKLLDEGNECLSKWFDWIAPWDEKLELNRPGHLVWLSIVGIALHAWMKKNFNVIASVWGKLLEVEDLTLSRDQTHVGRARVLTKLHETIDEVINFSVDGNVFHVRVMEDLIEIVDFGPCYDGEDTQLMQSDEADEEQSNAASDCDSDTGSAVPESLPGVVGVLKTKRQVVETSFGLKVLQELNGLHVADDIWLLAKHVH